jgi:excisionase family DNA binding protein
MHGVKTPPHKPPHIPPQPRLAYSIDETASMLGVSRPTLYKMIWRAELRTVKVGSRRLVPASELDRLLGG